MKNKKGDVVPLVIYALIIFAVITVFFFVLSGRYNIYLKKFFGEEMCKENIKTHSRLHIGGIEAFSDVNCPVEYITVEKDENINKELAYQMADCWDKYGEGRLKLFSNEWMSTEKFCAVCNYIKFDKKQEIDGKDFLQYLKENPAPLKFTEDIFEKQEVSYYTYLSGYQTEELDLDKIPHGMYNIDTTQPYGIMFAYTKKGDFFSLETSSKAALGIGLGLTAAGVHLLKGLILGRTLTVPGIIATGTIGAVGGAYSAIKIGGVPQQVDSAVVLLPYDETELQKLNCEIFPVKPGVKKEK